MHLCPFGIELNQCLILSLLACFAPLCGQAQTTNSIRLADSPIFLEIPEGWSKEVIDGKERMLPPASEQSRFSHRKIHLTYARLGSATLEEAAESEVDRLTATSPKWGSGNDRHHYRGCTPVETESGMSGLRADFAAQTEDGDLYNVIKYYFFIEKRIFKVCAHVYGDAAQLEQYDTLIRAGLHAPEKK